MSYIFTNVLSDEELYYLNNHPEVLVAESLVDTQSSGTIYFSVPITDSLRSNLETRFGLHLSLDSQIPMRWVKGNTVPEADVGSSNFDNTYLVYLDNSPGEEVLCQVEGVEKYIPIEQLNNGTLVKTSSDGFKPVVLVGKEPFKILEIMNEIKVVTTDVSLPSAPSILNTKMVCILQVAILF